jgi:hypothetical protein
MQKFGGIGVAMYPVELEGFAPIPGSSTIFFICGGKGSGVPVIPTYPRWGVTGNKLRFPPRIKIIGRDCIGTMGKKLGRPFVGGSGTGCGFGFAPGSGIGRGPTGIR